MSQVPVYLAGFQDNRPATGVHDDLWARALSIRIVNETTNYATPEQFILVVCDLIGLAHADICRVRVEVQKRGVDARGLVIACTHTHSGPDTLGLWGPSRFKTGLDPAYQAFVVEQAAQAACDAVQTLQPASLRAGRTEMARWIRNARQPQVVDRELSVLQAVGENGATIFTLLNLACHPEVMFGENTLITSDFAGVARETVEAEQGGVAIWASADIGGMMTPDVEGHGRSFDTVAQMGRDVALTALTALENGQLVEPQGLRFRRRDVRIPLDTPLFKFARALGTLPPLPLDQGGQIRTQVSLLDLGALKLVAVPGELLPKPGMRLRSMMNTSYRFLIGLADDELGYLIPSDEFVFPGNPFAPQAHYEETMSVSRYALPLLMEAWSALLADVE
ncbi:MAG: neutral/alkaline non-lysosomal ceramidase N-terminal domain-containing protein [Anaerolineae bacterium]|nr:neutral/alkaline non-lysosomal ceramidase N-terminal domain-containing protein [Anaerolineae bacterium]